MLERTDAEMLDWLFTRAMFGQPYSNNIWDCNIIFKYSCHKHGDWRAMIKYAMSMDYESLEMEAEDAG